MGHEDLSSKLGWGNIRDVEGELEDMVCINTVRVIPQSFWLAYFCGNNTVSI